MQELDIKGILLIIDNVFANANEIMAGLIVKL